MATTQASLGNTFTNASVGMNLKLGQFNSSCASSFYHSSIGTPVTEGDSHELFFYFLRGSFMKPSMPLYREAVRYKRRLGFISEPNHYLYMHELGLVCSRHRWTIKTVYFYRKKDAKSMQNNERYGSFSVSYRFGK